ncbi:MAG TPA: LytR C-terminal domain-containing protein [Gemmatimonadales bacterium]|nr:LytR C-terminal domain-containing protein [Gemmatimonadales bacterium]
MLAGCGHTADQRPAFAVPGDHGDRLEVEVLNASGRAGIARTATRVLREAGIDVVGIGNAPGGITGRLDSTRIVVRHGPASNGERVRRALRVGRVVIEPDSTRLLDVSVFVGADFAPPLEFHP